MPVKYDFNETFEREKFDGDFFGKGDLHYTINRLCKIKSHNVFDFFFIIVYFMQMVRLRISLVCTAVQINSS